MEVTVNLRVPSPTDLRDLVDMQTLVKRAAQETGIRYPGSITGNDHDRQMLLSCADVNEYIEFEAALRRSAERVGYKTEIGYAPMPVINLSLGN